MSEKTYIYEYGKDELDELSAKENEVTGKNVDYKQMDRDNITVVIKLLEE
jgi:hypothetical protein